MWIYIYNYICSISCWLGFCSSKLLTSQQNDLRATTVWYCEPIFSRLNRLINYFCLTMSVEIHGLQEEWDVKHQNEAFKEARPHESLQARTSANNVPIKQMHLKLQIEQGCRMSYRWNGLIKINLNKRIDLLNPPAWNKM